MKEVLLVHDEDARGNRTHTTRIPCVSQQIAVRDLITQRINKEVERFNAQRPVCFFALVQPEDAEITSRGYRLRTHRAIDATAQVEAALAGFEKKAFLINANGRDYVDLDDEIEINDETEIVFVKFVEVVGG